MLSLLAAALALAPHPPHCDSPRVDPLIRRAAWLQTTLPARHPLRRTLPPAEPAGDLPVSIRFVRPLRSAERAALADSYGLRFASAESRDPPVPGSVERTSCRVRFQAARFVPFLLES